LVVLGVYSFGYWVAKTVFLSLIPPLFWIRSNPRIQEISDIFQVNRLLIAALGAGLGTFLCLKLIPKSWQMFDLKELLTPEERIQLVRAFFSAVFLTLSFLLAFLFAGTHRFFGNVLATDQLLSELSLVIARVLLILMMTVSDELIFRGYILKTLSTQYTRITSTIVTSGLFVWMKWVQFPIGLSQGLTTYLVSFLISYWTLSFVFSLRPAFFWAGCLTVINPIMSLPIFGSELPGFLMVKYLSNDTTSRLLTGGAGGPLSSVLLQGFLIAWFVRLLYRSHKR
jgi:membrane protease YdiL (CAAX protease family)